MAILKNEKGSIELGSYRDWMVKVRGGWTKKKIESHLGRGSSEASEISFYREMLKYDTPEEFRSNLFFHGSGRYISRLKPSIVLKNTEDFGGGSGDKYYGISVSTDKDIASNFTGASRSGNVAPVLLKRGAIVETIADIFDATEIEDIIVDLWTKGIDAVVIGNHDFKHSEKEVVILNPRCIVVGKPESFMVFGKKPMPSPSKDDIVEMWSNGSEKYKVLSDKAWEIHSERMEAKYGNPLPEENKWPNSKN